jgi:hypothetical protein
MKSVIKHDRVELAVAVMVDKKYVTVYSPHLAIYAVGKTEAEAFKRFDKSVDRFYAYYDSKKTLHAKLASLGWTPVDHTVMPPSNFKVPTNLLSGKGSTTINNRKVNVPAYAASC